MVKSMLSNGAQQTESSRLEVPIGKSSYGMSLNVSGMLYWPGPLWERLHIICYSIGKESRHDIGAHKMYKPVSLSV